MKNVAVQIKNNKLVLKIDLSKSHGTSKSGKSNVIATTEGNIEVTGHQDVKFGLNVFQYQPRKKATAK